MPKKKVEKVHVNITIDEDLNQWLEKTAVELRMNKSQLINNLILMGKDDVGLMKGAGVLGAAKVIRKLKEELLRMKKKGVALESG
jgi:hypothetical protein